MKKQDWLDYFEAVNGRSPEQAEIDKAKLNGDFTEEGEEEQVVEKTAVESKESTSQAPLVDSNNSQTVVIQQVAAPSPFTIFWKQFWNWLVASWKNPTLEQVSHKYNGLTAFGLLAFFSTLAFSAAFIKAGIMDFSGFISVFVGLAFVYFSFIFGGFVVKRLVYREESFTLGASFEWFGRLLSLNLLFTALATVFAFINVNTLAFLLIAASYFVFVAASSYTLFHAKNNSSLDLFYKYMIACVAYAVIVVIFMMIGGAIAGEMIFNSVMGQFSNVVDNSIYGGFGY
ncbi:DUF6574 domain-containing protein [Streptococcus loxodontisalivarius]|uniref:Uncharacterized protein n=1 Tax=Streptococcus loxodontisalivarius TaxID=1349415 RepID=A0ABS2PTS1_9STRE|nr:DUF6574 domain-containing protein [Streptococcus loxodontisalivarius]MBM7643434.1 hypothetical protein [Streptococcus loxodontisalivarius]